MIQYSAITKDDGPALCELGALMHEESSYSELEFNPSRVIETFNAYLDNDTRACFIASEDGKPVGLYAGCDFSICSKIGLKREARLKSG